MAAHHDNTKLVIPLKEEMHPHAYFAEEEPGWHGYAL